MDWFSLKKEKTAESRLAYLVLDLLKVGSLVAVKVGLKVGFKVTCNLGTETISYEPIVN